MGAFGVGVVAVALWRALDPATPDGVIMGGVSVLALIANLSAAALLFWHRGDDLNTRSVWLCSRNDAIGNLLVIAAASGVFLSATAWPDVIVGAVIAGLELSAAWSITREAMRQLRAESRLAG